MLPKRRGINPYRTRMLAMVLSGAFAGLAGAGEVLGNFGRFIDRFSPGYGFDGVTVAIWTRAPVGHFGRSVGGRGT